MDEPRVAYEASGTAEGHLSKVKGSRKQWDTFKKTYKLLNHHCVKNEEREDAEKAALPFTLGHYSVSVIINI